MGVVWILMWPLVLGVWAVFRLPGPPTAPEKPGRFQPGRLPPGGVAVSDLRPDGTVEVAGRRYAATAEGGLVPAGQRVEIVGRVGRVLRVRGHLVQPGTAIESGESGA